MIDLSVTKEEIESLNYYYSKKYEAINQMLVSNCETDIALLSAEDENKSVRIPYNREAIVDYVTTTRNVYRLLLKDFYKNYSLDREEVYRGTNISEIERIKNDIYVDRFLTGTLNKEDAENKYAGNWSRPACMNITLSNELPYTYVKKFISESDCVLISPFSKASSIIESEEKVLSKQSKQLKTFDVFLEKQELDSLEDQERFGLYNYILENAYSINHKIEECIDLEEKNASNFEEIRKLEQLIAKYENQIDENPELEENNLKEIEKLNIELDELKEKSNDLFEKKKDNINYVNMWKRNIAVYMIAECKEIENVYEENRLDAIAKAAEIAREKEKEIALKEEQEKLEKEAEETKELDESLEEAVEDKKIEQSENIDINNEENSVEESSKEISKEDVSEEIEDDDPLFFRVKTECKENVDAGKKLIKDIEDLISKQQNHAKIAGQIGASYSALNNGFEMKKRAEELLEMMTQIKEKTNNLCIIEEKDKNKRAINKISKNNLEISTLINYLNNPKIAIRDSRINRFSEMAIIEENELKRGIAERVRDIRGEAELKKLKDDLEIIENKSTIKRVIGFFTGKNKLDDFIIEQIETRQKAIRRTLSKNLGLAHNYSIHELIAEIEMFINENSDDELITDDVDELRNLASELRNNFIILDSKVQSIIEEREGRNLPVEQEKKNKLSKRELIEIDTYKFLNKYGYDIASFIDSQEPEYQDTMTNEINRIIDYIKTSKVLN